GVRRGPHEESAWLRRVCAAALLARVRAEPRTVTFAIAERRRVLRARRHREVARFAALTPNRNRRQIAAGAALVHPQRLPQTLVVGTVDEQPPIDVADMTARARLDESNRNNFVPLA